jgi:hypothetical protein
MNENCLSGGRFENYKSMLTTFKRGNFFLHNARMKVEKSEIFRFFNITESDRQGVFNCYITYIRNRQCKLKFLISIVFLI